MLDLLFNPQKAERDPVGMMIIGLFYSSLSVFLGLWIFDQSTSLAIVFLTVFSCLYIVQGAIKMEEKKERIWNSEKWLLNQHRPIAMMILFLFIGMTIAFALWSFFLPPETSAIIFELQSTSVQQIKLITGNATNTMFPIIQILTNNLNIILISLVFALFYGAGAIYILVWNASVMGFVIGTTARESVGLAALPVAFTKYFIHGLPEILAYILASIAGGILYFAFIKGDLIKKDRLKRIIIDITTLLSISVLLLVFSAILEVYVSALI
ncbi:stage II sporulation protein M [Candidatus Pacearchaeota archaeon]|nr:stage II sporulation protein M [Candidatus Pacearchaeota archaeon]